MKSNKEAKRIAKKLFEVALSGGKLDLQVLRTIIAKLGDSRPRGYLKIAGELGRLARLELEKSQAIVDSAVPLDAPTQGRVLADLRAKYGPQVEAEFRIAPELIGGMRIRIGSDVWDGSVLNRIERLETKFS